MTKNVINDLAKELHRMNNASPHLPTEGAIKCTLDTYLTPHLNLDNSANVLCPRVWETFYNLWKDVKDSPWGCEKSVLPVWLTSEHMMRRHPKFFLNARMMHGPCMLGVRKDGTKITYTAGHHLAGVTDCQLVPGLHENIQDTKCLHNGIIGKSLTTIINSACDDLAEKWDRIINSGGMVFPYAPLVMISSSDKYWTDKIEFKTRYGVLSKEHYDP